MEDYNQTPAKMEGGVSANANNFVSEKQSSVVGKPELRTPTKGNKHEQRALKFQRSSSRREQESQEFADFLMEEDWSTNLDNLSNHPDIKKIDDVDQFLQN